MTTITDPAIADAQRIVVGYLKGRIKASSLHYEMFGRPCPHLPTEVEAAFQHACTEWWVWQDAESPEGGRDVPECDPLTHAENCWTLLIEALARLVEAVDAHTATRNANRSAA